MSFKYKHRKPKYKVHLKGEPEDKPKHYRKRLKLFPLSVEAALRKALNTPPESPRKRLSVR